MDREDFALVLSSLDPDPVAGGARGPGRGAGRGRRRGQRRASSQAMLKDEDPGVLAGVLEALRKARGADAADTLRRHLEHPDFAVRAAAAKGLAALKATGLGAALRAGLHAVARSDADLDVRAGAWSTPWPRRRTSGPRATLREAARSDPARVVRARAAAAALRAQELEAPDPGAVAVDRPPLDYREAMAPYDPAPDVAAVHAARHPAHAPRHDRDPPQRGGGAAHRRLVHGPRPPRLLRRARPSTAWCPTS